MCAITGGPSDPTEDAYIEWHWYVKYRDPSSDITAAHVTGKFIFVASAAYILSRYNKDRYNGNGIGMFNPSNHNP